MEEIKNSVEQPVALEAPVMEVNVENKEQGSLEKSQENRALSEAQGSTGKFKDVPSLLEAYNNLQAEFTRKCQRLSELEKATQAYAEPDNQTAENLMTENPILAEEVVKAYLEQVRSSQTFATISGAGGGGIPVSAPPNPTTLEEARQVLKNMFK